MEKNLNVSFTEADFLALARQKYSELQALDQHLTFYDYEKSFEAIWLELGRQVLEQKLGPVPADRRKKKDSDALRGSVDC